MGKIEIDIKEQRRKTIVSVNLKFNEKSNENKVLN